jgi:WD40 repeat protein
MSRDRKYLLTGSLDSTAILYNVENGVIIRVLEGHEDKITSVAISYKTKALTSSSDTVILWNLITGKVIKTMKIKYNDLFSISINTTGNRIILGGEGKLPVV